MGQCCAKCKETQDVDEGERAEGEGRDSTVSPLLTTAEPPATESPTSKSPPAAESPTSKSPPAAESPTSKSPPAASSAARFPVVESPEADSPAPQDVSTPPSQQQDETSVLRESPSLAHDTSSAASVAPPMGEFLKFPILQDQKTMEYVQKSKVMVILKGLPGSGKSVISSTLKEKYTGAVVCSADYYFMKDGEYKFNAEELKFAHEACQQSAKKAASTNAPLVVIDNTNLKAWTYKYYLGLSRGHHYTPLILEPQTPWAKDTKELARRNTHGISKDILEQKLKTYEPALPLYYWWFLNEADSSQIISMAQDWLRKSLQIQEFFQDFSKFSKLSSVEEMLSYYKRNEGDRDYKVLHATACVTRKGKAKNAKQYMAKRAVRDSLGKCFTLHLIGFFMTPRTFGVRLRLGEDSLKLWGMDDHETEAEDTIGRESPKPHQQPPKDVKKVSLGDASVSRDSCQTTLRTEPSQVHKEDRFHPTSGRGSRAHLTLGCAPQVYAKTTGFDLMKIVSYEQKMARAEFEQSGEKIETFPIPKGELRTFGDGTWVIYPEEEILVDSMFSAFY